MTKKRNLICMFFLFVFLKTLTYCDSGLLMSVFGTAIDDQKQTPIKGLKIMLYRIENEEVTDIKKAQTDDKGFFKIRFLKAGTYEFDLDIPGVGIVDMIDLYAETPEKDRRRFQIEDGKNLNLNFKVGPGEYPERIIEILKDKNQVNVTFHYGMFEPESSMMNKAADERNMNISSTAENCIVRFETVRSLL